MKRLMLWFLTTRKSYGGSFFDDGTICYTFASAGVHLTIVDEGVNGFTYYTFEGPAKERSYREGKIKSALGMWKLVKWAEAARGLG